MRRLLVNSKLLIVNCFNKLPRTKNLLISFFFLYTIYNILYTLHSPVYAQMATSRDWIGIFKQDDPDPTGTQKSTNDWKYVNCTKNPTDPVNWGECNFTMPTILGAYEFRLYANDSNVRVGTSNPFYVTASSGTESLCQFNRQATGLISTSQQIEGSFGNFVGTCITNPQAAYVPFKIPSYEELKTVFYTQMKTDSNKIKHPTLVGNQNQTNIPFSGAIDHLYHINGDLQLAANNIDNSRSGVVFVEGNLNITSNYTYGSGSTGAVYVVKGNIFISPAVTRVDAVLIAEGIICTSTPSSGSCSGVVTPGETQQLVINGNLIALSQTDPTPIKFRRNLSDNTLAAELVNHQSKYFVILKNIFSQTLTITTELN